MGGTTTITSSDFELTYFTERAGDPPVELVAAVVAWRAGLDRSESHWRALRRWAAGRLRPSRRPPDPRAGWRLPPGWDGASDGGGPREVLHSVERRAVRVAGGEYAVPADGRALVLLVDDRAGAGPPSVAVRAVAIAPQPAPRPAPGHSRRELARLFQAAGTRTRRSVLGALRGDAAVREFLPASAWDAV